MTRLKNIRLDFTNLNVKRSSPEKRGGIGPLEKQLIWELFPDEKKDDGGPKNSVRGVQAESSDAGTLPAASKCALSDENSV